MQPQELRDVFRANMRDRRLQLGITQCELASAIATKQTYISDLEAGNRYPNLATLAKIAEALDTTPSVLISASVVLAGKSTAIPV